MAEVKQAKVKLPETEKAQGREALTREAVKKPSAMGAGRRRRVKKAQ
jgi:hypothetical protein